MPDYQVVINDCAAPGGVLGGPTSIRTRDTAFGERNFALSYDNLASGLPTQLTDRQLDWLEIAGYLFAVDLACARGAGDLDWARSIEAWFPVRDDAFWASHTASLGGIFTALTGDRISLNFLGDSSAPSAPRMSSTSFPAYDCVSLLSGGLDSYVGTAELCRSGLKPIGISHIAGGATSRAQEAATANLRRFHAEFMRVKVSARKSGSNFPDPEPSQRSRSLLFLSVACVLAIAGSSNRVFINENGIMAVHLPLTAARVGSLSTRTASPSILKRVEQLANDVFETSLRVENDLVSATKPEVAAIAKTNGYELDLASTVSCWAIGRTSQHCGVCAPCLIRRISCELHEIQDAPYAIDAFADQSVLESEFAVDNLVHLIRTIDDLSLKGAVELQLDYPEILNACTALTLEEVVDLHKRWANQATQVMSGYPIPASLRT